MSTFAQAPSRKVGGGCSRQTVDKEHSSMTKCFKTQEEEIEYYKKTGHILFHYYNAVEKGNPRREAVPQTSSSKVSVLDMLNGRGSVGEVISHDKDDDYLFEYCEDDEDGTDFMFAPSKFSTLNRAELLDRFMKVLEIEDSGSNASAVSTVEMKCKHCGNPDLTVYTSEGITVCSRCDTVEEIMIESDKPGFKENQKSEISYFCYKRSNHFQEWISQTQGREHTSIPDEVYDQILTELKKQKFDNVANLKVGKLKEIMKKLHLNRYFEHISHILCHLNGSPVVNMSPELESQLRRMFQLIQAPFLIHAPKSRKNFMSYSYVLHKFLQLLGRDEYTKHFPLLKSRQKLHAQDQIWKKICETLRWEFIPSL